MADIIVVMKKPSKILEKISKKVGIAICDYNMLQDGDKVIIGISGGKDSLTLLKLLKYRQTFAPIKFDILAVHVDMGMPGMNVDRLTRYFNEEKINYRIEKIDILENKKWEDIGCFWCSWNRRKALFDLSNNLGYTKIAFGHHFDDIVETIMMNLLYQGNISAMLPNQELFKGKIRLIRPLAYVEEREIIEFSLENNFPEFIDKKCIYNNSSKRAVIKNIIKQLAEDNLSIKMNIFKGVNRIKKEYLL